MERTTPDQLTANDPRYRELFDAAKDAVSTSGRVEGDLTPRMSALRDQSPVMKGSLRRILELPEVHMAFDRPREHYTLFSFEYRRIDSSYAIGPHSVADVYGVAGGYRF